MSEHIIRTTNMPEHVREALSIWYEINEEIVRCMDCKFKRKSWNGKRPDFIPDGFFCAYWGGRELWKPDGFCAWGERRQP